MCTFITATAAAQSGASINGTVVDAQGGALPGVTLTLRNVDTGVLRTSVSEADGTYRFAGLPPGRYDLKSELAGFSTVEIKDTTLTIGLEVRRDIRMNIETLQESVTVIGQAPVVETTRSEVAQVVTQQQIESLPVNNRQAITLALLLPGTSQDGTRPRKVNATVGSGGSWFASAYLVDGVTNQQTSAGEPRQDFPQGGIQEFKVNVSQAPAEFGGTSGGVVTIVTKSGTNQFTGEAFEFFRDKRLNAMNRFEQLNHDTLGTPKPAFRRNQYGATLGGPVVMNKAHFLVAADLTETRQAITVNTGKPQLYSSVEGTFPNPSYRRTFLSRYDQQLTGKQNMFVRWAWEWDHTNCETCGATSAAFSGSRIDQRRHSLAGAHTMVIGSRMLNEFRAQYAPFSFLTSPPGTDVFTDPTNFAAERFSVQTAVYNFPSLTWGSDNSRVQKEWWKEFRDDFQITAGSHNVKFGGADVRGPNKDDSASNITHGAWTFSTDQPFNPNDPASIAALTNPILFTANAPPVYRDTKNSWFSTYVQDEWKPLSSLTLNLGVRYDLFYDSWNQQMDLSRFPRPLPFINPFTRGDHNNVGPRAGFAWDLRGDGESVVRGGAGKYFRNPAFGTPFGGEQTNLLQASIRISNPSYPDPYGGRSPLAFASTTPPNITIVDDRLQTPETNTYNAGFSQQLTTNLAVHVDSIYTKTTKDIEAVNINTPDPATRLRPLPEWGRIVQTQSIGSSTYRALMVRLDKRYADRFLYLVSYTLSKTYGYPIAGTITDAANPALDIGPAGTDRRHMLVSSGSLMAPGGVQVGAVWTLRSKMPFGAVAGLDLNGDGSVTDYVPGTSRNRFDLALVNAWRAQNRLGPIGASQFDSNRYTSLDVRVSKAIPLGGRRRIELIAQLFNVFGTDNLLPPGAGGYVDNALSDSFGTILSAQPRQQGEIAIRYAF
ncbi:MAG TPA: carboxypeptidase regulatory-like domain-containing protein [Vicinamibacterales bacterium]